MSVKTVGIVGAGLAGLTAAYRLTQKNIPCDIYEASDRVGGRAWSRSFANGQVYELGGEYIDSNHTSIIQLCRELGVSLVDAAPRSTKETYMVVDYEKPGNPLVRYSVEEAFSDYKKVFPRVQADAYAAWPSNQSFSPNNPKARELDRKSINEYVAEICTILDPVAPLKTKYAQALLVAYKIEYGEETNLQSALNLLFLMGYGDINTFAWFGTSDEKYNILGGTETLVHALQSYILGTGLARIFTNSPLTKLIRYPTNRGRYELRTKIRTGVYDAVIMTPSFEAYETFDYSEAQLSPLKKYIISNCKLGNNTKLNIQFNSALTSSGFRAYWESLGYSGTSYTTTGYQSTWDVSQDQGDNRHSVLCNYTGGDKALTLSSDFSMTNSDMRRQYLQKVTGEFLSELEATYPGITAYFKLEKEFNASIINWAEQPWTKGAYTCYRVGQYCGGSATLNANGSITPGSDSGAWNFVVPIATFEGLPEPAALPTASRNCFFAGESTTLDWQGWLNGATQTGEDVALAVNSFLKS